MLFRSTTAASDTITASYSGDANFLAGISAGTSLAVVTTDFSMSNLSGSVTASPGQPATDTFTVTPGSGTFTSTITFSVSGLPAGATSTFSPATFAAGSPGGTVQLTVTPAQTASLNRTGGIVFALLLLPLVSFRRVLRKLGSARLLTSVLLLTGLGFMTGCSNNWSIIQPASKSYTVTITGTSGPVQHTTTFTLNVS